MKNRLRVTATAGILALALAACGDAPDEETDSGGGETEAGGASDFQSCMVTDQGGADDSSFNESAYNGLLQAQEEIGTAEPTLVESNAETDYTPNVNELVSADCGLIVTVGFLLGDATAEAASANPEEQFTIVDFAYEEPLDNVKPLIFDTAQASFLAGYLAAGMTETGTVATFGGINIPTVSIFMDGYVDGVAYYNQEKGTDVQVLGWDKAAQDGSFTGDFQNQANGQNLANTFIQQGADIVMPVAGPVGLGAAQAAQDAGGVKIIWVDSDGYESAPDFADVFLTSVLKGIDTAVLAATEEAVNEEFTNEPFVGTLENDGVGIAPYHDFDGEVSDELKGEIDALREGITSGDVVVESPSSPQS